MMMVFSLCQWFSHDSVFIIFFLCWKILGIGMAVVYYKCHNTSLSCFAFCGGGDYIAMCVFLLLLFLLLFIILDICLKTVELTA